jgi:hypothetical protein
MGMDMDHAQACLKRIEGLLAALLAFLKTKADAPVFRQNAIGCGKTSWPAASVAFRLRI